VPKDYILSAILCFFGISWGAFSLYLIIIGPTNREPTGRDYFTVFAQLADKHTNVSAGTDATRTSSLVGADNFPVGSLPVPPAIRSQFPRFPQSRSTITEADADSRKHIQIELIETINDGALVKTAHGIRLIYPGDILPDGARFVRLEQQQGRWKIITQPHLTSTVVP